MRISRISAAVAAAAAFALVLTGCGSGSMSASSPEPAMSSSAEQKLTVWAWDPNFNIYALKEAEKIYKADHPNFTLDIVETPWDDLQVKLTTLAESHETSQLPDIFLVQNNAFQKNAINYPDVFADISGSGVKFDEFPASVTAYSTVDGKNYGVPFDNGTAINAMRTDYLAKAGYTLADFTDITWDEYITKGEMVLKKTGKPMFSAMAGSGDMIMMMLQSAGASLFDAEGKPTTAGNEALKRAIAIYAKMVKKGIVVEVNSWDEYLATMSGGTVVGTIQGVWINASLQSAKNQTGKWGITNLPSVPGIAGATNYSANGGSSWAVSAEGNKELAGDFLAKTFAGSTKFYDTILPGSGALANWLPAGASSVYSQPQPFFDNQPIYSTVVEYAKQVPANNTGVYYYEGRDAVSAAVTKVINGGDTDKALAEAQSAVEFAMS